MFLYTIWILSPKCSKKVLDLRGIKDSAKKKEKKKEEEIGTNIMQNYADITT